MNFLWHTPSISIAPISDAPPDAKSGSILKDPITNAEALSLILSLHTETACYTPSTS